MKRSLALALAACLVFAAGPSSAAGMRCRVEDPTGTPLNVRTAPNGAILTTLANGTAVEIVDEMKDGTKRWLFIAQEGARLGWVFGAYVACPQPGDARKAAPGEPALRP